MKTINSTNCERSLITKTIDRIAALFKNGRSVDGGQMTMLMMMQQQLQNQLKTHMQNQ